MKNLTHIIRTGALMLLTSLSMASCVDGNDWGTTSSNRLFGTKSSSFSVTPAAITAEAKWDATPNTEYYIIEVSPEALTDNISIGNATGSIVFGQDQLIKKSPCTLAGLLGETTYYIRIKSVGQGKESHWVYLADETFKTTKEQILNSVAKEDITDESLRITWTPNSTVTHLIISIKDDAVTQPITQPITAEEATTGVATISDLAPGTEYAISIYNGGIKRGEITAATNMSELAHSETTAITKTSATFTWDTEIGKITHYAWCEGSKTPTPSDHYTALTDAQVTASGVELTGLQPSTTYTIAVMKNSYVRAIQTFTTNKGVPAGFTKVIVTDMASWNEALSANTGKVALLIPENASIDLTLTGATVEIPNTISSLLVWGADANEDKVGIKPDFKTKGVKFNGTFDKVEFYNLHLFSNGSSGNYIIDNQSVATSNVKELILESCQIDEARGVARVRSSSIGAWNKCTINDCVLTGIGSYGVFAIDEAQQFSVS